MSFQSMFQNQDRAVPSVPPPLWDYLDQQILFPTKDAINIEAMKHHFLCEGRLRVENASDIITRASRILKEEPTLLRLSPNVKIVGDIHGQFYDLVKLLEIGGEPQEDIPYLFLGDYVDRGYFSCECMLLLLALKVMFPRCIYLLRGNHEARHLTSYFNFKQEAVVKYSMSVYELFMTAFDYLPLAARVGENIFCVHGGLSPDVCLVEDVSAIHRVREPPSSGPMCDLLWSDPHSELDDQAMSTSLSTKPLFTPNELRGCSYVFNFAAVQVFLQMNNLMTVIRAHEAQDLGYKLFRNGGQGFPSLINVFSAPNYCDSYNNLGAILIVAKSQFSVRQFHSSPHPYWLPNFMNAFTWSMPFMCERAVSIVDAMLNIEEPGGERHVRKSVDRSTPRTEIPPWQSEGPLRESSDVRQRVRQLAMVSRALEGDNAHR